MSLYSQFCSTRYLLVTIREQETNIYLYFIEEQFYCGFSTIFARKKVSISLFTFPFEAIEESRKHLGEVD